MAKQRPDVSRAFGEALRRFRTGADLTQEALAARCDLHATYISQLERGLKSPSLVTLVALAEALGVQASELVRVVEGLRQKPH